MNFARASYKSGLNWLGGDTGNLPSTTGCALMILGRLLHCHDNCPEAGSRDFLGAFGLGLVSEKEEVMQNLEDRIKALPPDIYQEVIDYIDYLMYKRGRSRGKKLRQDWAGGLREYQGLYTSLELQKQALVWRGD